MPCSAADYTHTLIGEQIMVDLGTFTCDVCGQDTPHGHAEFDVIQQRYARPAFEKRHTEYDPDSEELVATFKPQKRGPAVCDGYYNGDLNRLWHHYTGAWLDAWEHFKAQIKTLEAERDALKDHVEKPCKACGA
jgi:hypothetical protein